MRKPLIGDVSLEDLVERISFTELEVKDAVLEQAKLFLAACDYRVRKMKTRQEAESGLEKLSAELGLKLRKQHAAEGGKKPLTEGNLRDLLDAQGSVQDAKTQLATAKRLEEWAKLLLDGYWQRKDILKILAQFIHSEDTFRINQPDVDKMRNAKAQLRRAMPHKRDAEED